MGTLPPRSRAASLFFIILASMLISGAASAKASADVEKANVFDFGMTLGLPVGFTVTLQSWRVAGSDILLRGSLGYSIIAGGVSGGAGYILDNEGSVRQYLLASIWYMVVGLDEPSSGSVGFLEYGFRWNAFTVELGMGTRLSGDVSQYQLGFRVGVFL